MREVGCMEEISMKIEYIEMNLGKERVVTIESISRMTNGLKAYNPKPKTFYHRPVTIDRKPEVSHA